MVTGTESRFDVDDYRGYEVDDDDEVVRVTFPASLGRFDESIQFGSIGWYEKTLCKNPGDVSKVLKAGPRVCDDLGEISNSEIEPECEISCDDLQDDKNDEKIGFEGVDEVIYDEVIRDDLQDVKSDRVEDIDDLGEIPNSEIEPKCEIICDDLQDDKNDENIGFQEDDEVILDDEVIRDDFQDEKIDRVEDIDDLGEISNSEIEPECEISCDELQDDKNDEQIVFQGVDQVILDDKVIRDDLQDENRDRIKAINDLEEISNSEIEPKCEISCDGLQDDKNDDKIGFQGDEERHNEVLLDHKVTRDDLQFVKNEKVEDPVNLEEIPNSEIVPKCEIIRDDLQDDKNNEDEKIRDVNRLSIHVIDGEETEEVEKLNEEITNAKMHLDEKSRCRDEIRVELQKEKAKLKADNEVLNAANLELKEATRLVSSKRHEIDYAQSVVNKIKNAVSVEDVNSKIFEVNSMIKYKTLWLKDENQFICEIKQLKSMRDRLASDMGGQDEIHFVLVQKDKMDEILKNLKKEMKSLKENVSKAEVAVRALRKRYDEKKEKGKALQAKYRAADELRQQAYTRLSGLKKLLYNKDTSFEPLCMLSDEEKSVSAVSKVETGKAVLFVEEKPSGDQNWEKVESGNKYMMKNEQPVKPTEVIKNTATENMIREFVELNNEATQMKKQNAVNDCNQAAIQVQKESKQEKARLKRLRKKEKKRADSVTSSSHNTDIKQVSNSNEQNQIENTLEKPHQNSPPLFMPQQLTPNMTTLAIANQNYLQRHWRKMANVVGFVILAVVFSLRNIDFLTFF